MRGMFAAAWDRGFSEEDWDHTFGGLHVLRSVDGEIVAHGAVAERTLWLAGAPGTRPRLRGRARARRDRPARSAAGRALDRQAVVLRTPRMASVAGFTRRANRCRRRPDAGGIRSDLRPADSGDPGSRPG